MAAAVARQTAAKGFASDDFRRRRGRARPSLAFAAKAR